MIELVVGREVFRQFDNFDTPQGIENAFDVSEAA